MVRAVERVCSRFDAGSEVVQLAVRLEKAAMVSAMLFELTRVALELAHLVDGRTRRSPGDLASVTATAPTALAVDGLATAAHLLGLDRGVRLLESQGVQGGFVLPSLEVRTTEGFAACAT